MDFIKNLVGEPKTGVHAIRFMNTAIVDYILAILLAIVITYITQIPLVLTTIGVLIIGVITHYIFDIETGTTKLLFN